MKYVIWGCGKRGKRVIDMLGGIKRIVAVVESNKELHGSVYCGIPIISFEEFLQSYSSYPVIVTPRYFEDEIIEQLKLRNILGIFPFSREMHQVCSLLVQFPIDQTMKRYQGNDKLAIYGVSLIGLILYDLFSEHGFDVSLVIPSSADSLLQKYLRETLKLKMMTADDVKRSKIKLLLAAELEETDHDKFYGVAYDKYYDMHLQRELFYNPKLEKFKNIHDGKRCFIVATGPSLRMDDLDTLYHSGEICISVNGIFKAFDNTKWRPDYYVVDDPGVAQWKEHILEMDVQAKFVADLINCFNDQHYDNIYRWHLIWSQESPAFSDDFAYRGFAVASVVYSGALQLAVYMGFKEIYLLGTDCTVSADGKTPHFINDYYAEDPGCLDLDWMMVAYSTAKQYADSHGIKIYNATRGGALEIFPRVDFDSLFSQ